MVGCLIIYKGWLMTSMVVHHVFGMCIKQPMSCLRGMAIEVMVEVIVCYWILYVIVYVKA